MLTRNSTSDKRAALAVALASQLLASMWLPALADSTVRVASQQAFSVPAAVGGLSVDQRAAIMQKNVDNALVAANDRSPQAVSIVHVNGQYILTLGGFYVATVDQASAQKAGLTQEQLAQRWADGLKHTLGNQSQIESYVTNLEGGRRQDVATAGTTTNQSGSFPYYKQGHVVYIPAGMMMPVRLTTALDSDSARAGDLVQATLTQPINLGETEVPENSVLIGQVTDATAGRRLSHSGHLGIKFTRLRMPDGTETAIAAHIEGGIGKYKQDGAAASGEFRGETTAHKVEVAALHGAIGAGSGAVLGTVVGAIASHGYGTGRGALTGAVMGGVIGVAESTLLRKNSDVKVESGQTLNLVLDAPASFTDNGGRA